MKSSPSSTKTPNSASQSDQSPDNNPTFLYQVAVDRPNRSLWQLYTYQSIWQLLPGVVVRVKFGGKTTTGVIVKPIKQSPIDKERILPITKVVATTPYFSTQSLTAAKLFSHYYLVSFGEVLAAMLYANRIVKQVLAPLKWPTSSGAKPRLIYGRLNERINRYAELIQPTVESGGQTLIVTPTQDQAVNIARNFAELFGASKVALVDPKHKSAEEKRIFERISANTARIIIGTRKTFFLPIPELKRIIIEQPGQYSYFNDQKPAYNLSHVALQLADSIGLEVIFGDTAIGSEQALRISQHSVSLIPLSPPQSSLIELTGPIGAAIDRLDGQLNLIVVPFKDELGTGIKLSADVQSIARYLHAQQRHYVIITGDNRQPILPDKRPLYVIATTKITDLPGLVFNDALLLRADHWLTLPNYDNVFRLVELWQALRFSAQNHVYIHAQAPISETLQSPLVSASIMNRALSTLKHNQLPPYSIAVHITPKKDIDSLSPILTKAISTQQSDDKIIAFFPLALWPPANPDDWLRLCQRIVINPPN